VNRFPDLPDLKFFKRGKVREIYNYKEYYLMIASDRISCFDVILPTDIPFKGEILTRLSVYWFDFTKDIISNHLITSNVDDFPKELSKYKETFKGRTMLVKKAKPIPIECVVRGYLTGSGWSEYQKNQSVCGVNLHSGIKESEKLPEPIFTPATKEDEGHDINVNFKFIEDQIGTEVASKLRDLSINIYKKASEYAASKGIIIADTKFEFGWLDNNIILIDEVLTPDSSRFWLKDKYQPGVKQDSLDKQYVRNYLETLSWDKTYPGPDLPEEIVEGTYEKYCLALKLVAGEEIKR